MYLRPGLGAAYTTVATGYRCPSGGRQRFSAIRIGVPGGGTVTVPVDVDVCSGMSISAFIGPPRRTAQPYDGLTASVQAPPSARGGSVLDYTVTLTNRTAHDIALHPCPVFEEGVGGTGSAKTDHRSGLNCAAAPAIPRHTSVVFAMRIPVPDAPSPDAKLTWQLFYSRAATGTLLEITNR